MADSAPRIILFRESRDDDPYERALTAAGLDAAFVPVLAFEAMNGPALAVALARPEAFSGLVVTSERAARRLLEMGDPAAWKDRPVFAIGPRTRVVLKEGGYRQAGPDCQSGAELARHIVSVHADSRPLLFPCSARRRDELPDALRSAGLALTEIPVYDTVARLEAAFDPGEEPAWLAFFSPSGVEAAADFVRDHWPNALRAAIGPTTADALREAGITAHVVAPSPDADGLATAIAREQSAG